MFIFWNKKLKWKLGNLSVKVPINIRSRHRDLNSFPSALRIFLPLCERHFTVNDKNKLTINYLGLLKPTGSLTLSKDIINFHLLSHEQIRTFYRIIISLLVSHILTYTYLVSTLYILYIISFTVVLIILQKDIPTAFSPLGGLLCPHKKKKKKVTSN